MDERKQHTVDNYVTCSKGGMNELAEWMTDWTNDDDDGILTDWKSCME